MVVRWSIQNTNLHHRELWRCARFLVQHTESKPAGRYYFDLMAILMIFLALEAYLNTIGQALYPEIWSDEKNYFGSHHKYHGVLGKASFLCDKLGFQEHNRGCRPFQTIVQIKRIRDFLSHSHLEIVEFEVDSVDAPSPVETLEKAGRLKDVKPTLVHRAMKDVEAFADQLHTLAVNRHLDPLLGDRAFEGPLRFTKRTQTN